MFKNLHDNNPVYFLYNNIYNIYRIKILCFVFYIIIGIGIPKIPKFANNGITEK